MMKRTLRLLSVAFGISVGCLEAQSNKGIALDTHKGKTFEVAFGKQETISFLKVYRDRKLVAHVQDPDKTKRILIELFDDFYPLWKDNKWKDIDALHLDKPDPKGGSHFNPENGEMLDGFTFVVISDLVFLEPQTQKGKEIINKIFVERLKDHPWAKVTNTSESNHKSGPE